PGHEITIEVTAPVPLEAIAEEADLEVLYQDRDLVVVNKPQGLVVHPSETRPSGTLVNRLLFHIKDLSGIGGKLRPGIVHRLDADTSGVLVVTKTDAAHLALSKTFKNHDLDRIYWALCYGCPGDGKLKTHLGRSPTDRKKIAVLPSPHGKSAITHYRTLKNFGFASLVECRLETGRTHQIRVHLAHLGTSILGDPVYGVPTSRASKWTRLPAAIRTLVTDLPGQALHARVLGFAHPISGKPLRFETEPPPAFQNVLKTLSLQDGGSDEK
ncbi:MAG: RluA family pseudouridine synthase, partial [Bdellovibrionota bacterium]